MRIESGAGNFEMTVLSVEPQGKNLVLKSNMGIWVSDVVLEPREILSLIWLHMRPKVLLYALRLPWLAIRK